MTDTRRLKMLETLACMLRDRDMARLHRLASAQALTRARIEQVSQPVPLVEEPALFTARQAHLHWATAQRMQLNTTLARETAQVLEQRRKTARSFGRALALAHLCAQKKPGAR